MPRLNWKLSNSQIHEARRAFELKGTRTVTLEECVRIALQIQTTDSVSIRCTDAVDQFLAAILRRGRREATYQFYYERLQWWLSQPVDTLDDWDRPRLKRALEGKLIAGTEAWMPNTIRMTYRAIRALYGWALQQNPPLARRNPCIGLKLDLPVPERAIQFLAVDQVRQIVQGVPERMRPAVVLLFFGGLRPEEIAPRSNKPRLQWSHVNTAERYIRVPGDVAKVSGASRIIQRLPDTMWALLPAPLEGPVCPYSAEWLVRAMRAELGTPWIQDVTRHTFATYAMALEENASKVSEWLGHEGEISVFHRHYKGLISREIALGYWAIRSRA